MTTAADVAATHLRDLVTEVAAAQISRPIAHEFDIAFDTDPVDGLEPPAGHRVPEDGPATIRVVAQSRSARQAAAEVRVSVWPAADDSGLTVVREGTDRSLAVGLDELRAPDALRGRLHDFVAVQVASVVSELNVAMQRPIDHRDPQVEDVAEYDGD